jgi:hypothetical protein
MKKIFLILAVFSFSMYWMGCKVDDQFDGPDLNDVYGPIVLMRAIFTSHTHPAPTGVTGIPFKGQL